MSFGGRIKRGPMAADVFEKQFTQIYNGLFRDTRLSFKAKGIFGLISTHRDGFGISLESIAACSTDGIAGVRTGLLELIEFNYLQRDRTRDDRGRLGDSVYFITDMPDGLLILMNPDWDTPEVETGRSEPTCDSPKLAQPTEGNHPHKKTNSNKISSKKTTSPSRMPKPQPAAPPVKAEEEDSTATSPEHQRARLFLMRLPAPWTLGPADAAKVAPTLAAAVSRLGLDYDDQLTAQIACNDFGVQNYAAVIETKRIPNLRPAAPKPTALPAACPACLAETPAAARNKQWRRRNGRPCPDCHPDAAPAAA